MTQVAASLANRLLRDDAWARSQLSQHAGKSFRLSLPPFALALRVGAQGELEALAKAPAAFDLELILPATALPLGLAGRETLERAVEARGDTALAQTLRELADAMPWFLERELERWVGPIVARRLTEVARDLLAWPGYAAQRLAATASTYFTEERMSLLKRVDLDYLSASVNRLRDDVARLEQRIEKKEKGEGGREKRYT